MDIAPGRLRISGWMLESKEFYNRRDETDALVRALRDTAIRVIAITGRTGTGKTALAGRLYEHAELGRFDKRSRHFALRPGRTTGVEDWLVASIAQDLLPKFPPNSTRTELEGYILEQTSNVRTLLVVDNVERLDKKWFLAFITSWIERQSQSCLLFTSSDSDEPSVPVGPSITHCRLKGFPDNDTEAILSLLGKRLRSRFKDTDLLKCSRQLDNIPQKLIYLKISNPTAASELTHLVKSLSEDEFASGLVQRIQQTITGPTIPFLALGRVREFEFEEGLFSSLWQDLGAGGAAAYISVRNQLMAAGLLDRAAHESLSVLRIHPNVHMQLERELELRLGLAHIAHVDYFLAEYYRSRFVESEQNTTGSPKLNLLARYIEHAESAGNLRSAVEYLLEPSRIERFHRMGLALELRPILSGLDQHVRTLTENIELWWIRVKIELARCDNDLSDHQLCLEHLDDAEKTLIGTTREDDQTMSFRQQINYLRGVAFSNLGRSTDCVSAYMMVGEDAANRGHHDARSILALGYLAYEMRYHDLIRALDLSNRALQLSTLLGDSSVSAKTKCSVGQVYYFADHPHHAARLLDEAEHICRNPAGRSDSRELGRILLARAMVRITQNKFDLALNLLRETQTLTEKSGDRRRLAIANALIGITLWRSGQPEQGLRALSEAIAAHNRIKEWGNLFCEALSYAYMIGHRTTAEATRAALEVGHGEPWASVLLDKTAPTNALNLFGRFWQNAYRVRLLEEGS